MLAVPAAGPALAPVPAPAAAAAPAAWSVAPWGVAAQWGAPVLAHWPRYLGQHKAHKAHSPVREMREREMVE